MSIEIARLSPDELTRVRDQVIAVYGAAFAPPPYNRTEAHTADFRYSLPRHAQHEGFRCEVARARVTGEIVGFTYGYTGAPGQWWTDVVSKALGPELTRRWLTGHFEFAELAVLPAFQSRGIGGRLHDALLDELPHHTTALSTIDEETAAFHLYRKRGWVVLLEHLVFPNVPEPFRIMGKELHPAPAGRPRLHRRRTKEQHRAGL